MKKKSKKQGKIRVNFVYNFALFSEKNKTREFCISQGHKKEGLKHDSYIYNFTSNFCHFPLGSVKSKNILLIYFTIDWSKVMRNCLVGVLNNGICHFPLLMQLSYKPSLVAPFWISTGATSMSSTDLVWPK